MVSPQLPSRDDEVLKNHDETLHNDDSAVEPNPAYLAELRKRATGLTSLGRLTEAAATYDAAIALSGEDSDLLMRRAVVFNQLDRSHEALKDINLAIVLKPRDLNILNARALILGNLGEYSDALSDLDRILSLEPGNIEAVNSSAMILARMGRFSDALKCYNYSLTAKADQTNVVYERSLVRLALGDWIRGFREFESRWFISPLSNMRLKGLGALWLGNDEDLSHKTLLLYHELDYGDTFQCVRYIQALTERGALVILAVPPTLALLMRSVPGVSRVVIDTQTLPQHDYQCPLMSLPLAFRTTPDTIPAQNPYLRADPTQVNDARRRLGSTSKKRIGIVWSGTPLESIYDRRDMPLAALRPLLALDADFIYLQWRISDSDRVALDTIPSLQRWALPLDDFDAAAALIETLDLLITVDTAFAHLAGAMGKPVWLMNQFASSWRWLNDSSWYPTLQYFRQSSLGDWTSVVCAICDAANHFLSAAAATVVAVPRPTTKQHSGVSNQLAQRDKIRFVSATRLSSEDFFSTAPLGRSLPIYRTFPKRQVIELRLFPYNKEGLPSIYNMAIEEAKHDPAILIFIHDDVYLSDYYWAEHLHVALDHFDLVGLAGNRRRVPRQASWMYLDDQFTRDNYDNLSGVLGHGEPFPNLRQLSVYGDPGQEVKILDGVMMAIRSCTLIDRDLRFDPRFKFHFYDLDFCRQAELRKVRMGTWAISVVHASAGKLGVESWRTAYADYLAKYSEA